MDEKRVTLQDTDFESFVRLAESIVQEAMVARPTEVVAVRSRWGGSQLKSKPLSFTAESAALARYTQLD